MNLETTQALMELKMIHAKIDHLEAEIKSLNSEITKILRTIRATQSAEEVDEFVKNMYAIK